MLSLGAHRTAMAVTASDGQNFRTGMIDRQIRCQYTNTVAEETFRLLAGNTGVVCMTLLLLRGSR